MVEFKLKALREWRNFLRILAGVLLIVCLLGFWKFFGHGPKGGRCRRMVAQGRGGGFYAAAQ